MMRKSAARAGKTGVGATKKKVVRRKKLNGFWAVIQKGGTCECWGEAYATEREAQRAVKYHERASYAATYLHIGQPGLTIEQAQDLADAMAEAAMEFTLLR
jgi:hypothetical protein